MVLVRFNGICLAAGWSTEDRSEVPVETSDVSEMRFLTAETAKSVTRARMIFFFFGLFAFSWAAPEAYGGSQARSLIRAVDPGLGQSHSHMGSELRLQPTPQLVATPDP